ncbi:MAG: Crp/Fnr family transcriptional regulator [Cyclonatronaceae bacterium]
MPTANYSNAANTRTASVDSRNHSLKLWYIKHYNFFGEVTEEVKRFVRPRTSMISYSPKDVLYISGQQEMVYMLKKGQVKISRIQKDGREVLQELLKPGEIFGALPFTGEAGEKLTEYAQAATETVVCTLQKKHFEQLLDEHPKMNRQLSLWYGERMRRSEERVNNMIFKNVRSRIALFLVRHAESFGRQSGEGITFEATLTHEEIGLLVGAARQTVTSVLNELRQHNIISFDRRIWSIKNKPALQEIAG